MGGLFEFEDFSSATSAGHADGGASSGSGMTMNDAELEERRLAAYEEGYAAGWKDAAKVDEENQTKVSETFARNLEDLAFTYQEALEHMQNASEPILRQLVTKMFPGLCEASLCDHILQRLQSEIKEEANQPVEIVLAPQNRMAVENLIGSDPHLNVRLVDEPALAEGQAFLRFTAREEAIDLSEVQKQFEEALDAFFASPPETKKAVNSDG